MPYTSAIIVAAGQSSRIGIDKIVLQKDGIPLIAYTISRFALAETINEIIVVTRLEIIDNIREIVKNLKIKKIVKVVCGGHCRQASVKCGIENISNKSLFVCIHDGARPFVTAKEIDTVNRAAYQYKAACCGSYVKDTIKTVNEHGFIEKTLDRNKIVLAATPQVFEATLYRNMLKSLSNKIDQFTDDSSMIESLGLPVYFVECSPKNIKITVKEDIYSLHDLSM